MRVIGVAGWSGAGKTTLLAKIIPELNRRGVSVSTIKHAHHGFDVDRPGKDSFEHRAAGASEVLISSGRRWALVHELRAEQEATLAELLRRLSPVDVVLVEGFKAEPHRKIEVFRAANGRPFLFPDRPDVVAMASDVPVPDATVPVLHLDDISAIADEVLRLSAPLNDVLTQLAAGRPTTSRTAPPERSA